MMSESKFRPLVSATCALVLCSFSLDGAERRNAPNYFEEDFPVQGACISAQFPTNNVAMKGLAIRVGNGANMLWDTDLLRFAAGWTGGYISGKGVAFDGGHGSHPSLTGTQLFGAKQTPGWANARGEFVDNRKEPFGPLSADWCRWNGLYVNGMNVGLSYTVHGAKIFEEPSSVTSDGEVGFVRTIRVGAPVKGSKAASLALLLCDVVNAAAEINGHTAALTHGDHVTMVSVVDAPAGSSLQSPEPGRVVLKLGSSPGTFKIVLWKGRTENAGVFAKLCEGKPKLADFTKGGLAHWPEPVVTQGKLNTSQTPDGAYVTDSITAPAPNPWNRRVRFGGMDFFSDGKRAALCTHEGDVWIVEGIDETLAELKWRRFASGGYETLGLAIVDDVIYTSGRDQITRYRDLNKDGEADYYENFNNEIMSTEGFHEFVFDLQTDKDGNFYFAKANPVNSGGSGFGRGGGNGSVCSHSGGLFKVSKDGKKFEIIATGFRAPNGIGVSPDGQVTTSDNEGTWVPTTPINWIQTGGFHGVSNRFTSTKTMDRFIPPLTWLPKDYDNSGGGQIVVTSDKWGPYKGEWLHESYGRSSLFLMLKERGANGQMQGGVVKFPLKFTSSVMRARFNPRDGQLYIAGLSEWQSNAAKNTGFDRVRYTGKKVYSVRGLKVLKDGVQLTFTEPLATDSVADLQNWSGKRWNYARTEKYGSPEFTLTSGENGKPKGGRDTLSITGATLSSDGKSVKVQIADFKPAMSEIIRFNLTAADGTPVAQEVLHTIHAIP
jgi:hypothetical protein